MTACNVLIVGGGVAGLATAWTLAQRGVRDVVLLEREPVLAAQSSARSASILRSVVSDPTLLELTLQGSTFLRSPPAGFARRPLIDPVGVLLTASREHAGELHRWAELVGGRLRVERLDAASARHLAPFYRGPADEALWIPDEGRIDVAELVGALERGARAGGVTLRSSSEVVELVRDGSTIRGVGLRGGGTLAAATTVIAAGGWAGKLAKLAGSRVRVRPTRRHVATTQPDRRVDARWPIVWGLGAEFYARPHEGGWLACACDETDVDPDRCEIDPGAASAIAGKLASLMPDYADAARREVWCGMRTFAADHGFLVGADPDLAGLFWVAGLGGHGLTCAAPVGRIASALLLREPVDERVRAWLEPGRFDRALAGDRP